jgi:ring-1,2-phenylacetyl-CoA epoxidase subunit PaaA
MDSSTKLTEERLLARIEAGERIESSAEMTEPYRQSLIHLMTMQADSELAGAFGYVPWIMKAPTIEEKHVVAQIVKDEVRHAHVMYGLLEDLGVDVPAHIGRHDFALRLDDANADIGTGRAAADQRVNIFYYPIDRWSDFVFFNFCMDRGAGHQLEDVRQCSYGPWARAIEGIFKEEKMHIRHGELWVKRLTTADEATRAEAQDALDKWYVRTMNIFGRPNSPKNRLYQKFRLKTRDNDEVRRTFSTEVKTLAGEAGLRVPDWRPVWDKLPEEAQIPG